jgi:hypothetical protein
MTLFSHDDDPDDPKIFIKKRPLSPQAQAIMDVYHAAPVVGVGLDAADRLGIAAAIKALVQQTLPEEPEYPMGTCGIKQLQREERDRLRTQQLAVAAELEGKP